MSELFTALGLVLVIEGIGYALAPGRFKAMMALASQIPEERLRTGGIFAVAAGVVVVWIARQYLSGG
jgi:uncharacterized protein YjeT (DUF2065 family)